MTFGQITGRQTFKNLNFLKINTINIIIYSLFTINGSNFALTNESKVSKNCF